MYVNVNECHDTGRTKQKRKYNNTQQHDRKNF